MNMIDVDSVSAVAVSAALHVDHVVRQQGMIPPKEYTHMALAQEFARLLSDIDSHASWEQRSAALMSTASEIATTMLALKHIRRDTRSHTDQRMKIVQCLTPAWIDAFYTERVEQMITLSDQLTRSRTPHRTPHP